MLMGRFSIGSLRKFRLTQYLDDITKRPSSEIHSCEIQEVNIYESSFSTGDRTRAYLKVKMDVIIMFLFSLPS